jgi:hypothetical protein
MSSKGWKHFPIISIFVLQKKLCAFASLILCELCVKQQTTNNKQQTKNEKNKNKFCQTKNFSIFVLIKLV